MTADEPADRPADDSEPETDGGAQTGGGTGHDSDGMESDATAHSVQTHESAGDSRWSVRAVLVFGILAGLAYAVETVLTNPAQLGVASDVYVHAAQGLLDGENIYEVTPPDRPDYHYIYPPIVIGLFVPYAVLGGETVALAGQTLLNVTAGIGLGILVLRAVERRDVALTAIDRWLLVGFAVGSVYATTQIVQGQVTLWLAFALALGFTALETGRERAAGVAFAAAALIKVFPAAIGLWLLRLRSWGGVAAAIGTGLAGLALGAVVLGPELTVQYFSEVLLGRAEGATFEGTPDPERTLVTARRQVSALGAPSSLVTVLTLTILAPLVAVLYRRIDTDRRRLAAILGTLLVLLLAMPLQALYFSLLLYPLLVLLYVLPAGWVRRLLLAGMLLLYIRPGPDSVAVVVAPLPAGIESAAMGAAEAAFAFVQLPTLGMWLLVVACLWIQFDDRVAGEQSPLTERSPATEPPTKKSPPAGR
ncbi:DUF2029 domain-containing protein [Halobacteria archaeon AArc-dxtr1]|nr:DUF2029 domain-containing protein [Halobacteria archaeon AArc-dxtr1]